jgi:sulfoxide reductase heme-binding subunit YedZ
MWDLYQKRTGANPLEFATRTTGMLTLVFLFLTLAVTPVRKITGLDWLIKLRRLLGLFAFFYGAVHLLTYIWFDRFFNLARIFEDVAQRRFIAVGMAAFLLMVPLTVTSTNRMVKRLGGKRWIQLHRLVFLSAALGVLHFWMLVKSDYRLPLTFAFILGLLIGYRLLIRYFPPGTEVTSIRLLDRN